MIGIIILFLFLFLSLVGMPIIYSLGLSGLVYILFQGIPLSVLAHKMVYALDSFPLIAVPLFILAGNVMNISGITSRIFNFATHLVGFLPGGLGHVNVVSSMIFAGMSGSALADAGGLGLVELKAMKEAGYDDNFSIGITGASSCIGPIIPPSIPMVIYALGGGVSVGALFLGGIIPGIIMGLSLMTYCWVVSVKKGYPREKFPKFRQLVRSILSAFPALLTPIIIVGGIVSGMFTPTEAACVAVLYSIFLGLVIYRQLSIRDLYQIIIDSMETTVIILLIISAASVVGWIVVREGFDEKLLGVLTLFGKESWKILLIFNIILLIVGCFIDTIPAIFLMSPVVIPTMEKFGLDPVHIGVVLVLALMIGLYTPPMGTGLYILKAITGKSFETVFRAVFPFLIPLIITLMLITYIPALVMTIPKIFGLTN